jgi:hypothetical protein
MRRRLFLIGIVLVVGLLVAPTVSAVSLARTPGSVEFQLLNGAGTARVRHRGNFLGHVARGRIVATNSVTLSGCESRRALSATLKECRGTDLGFRTPGWTKWRVRLSGRGIDAAGYVAGCATLNGVDSGNRGRFRIGSVVRGWPVEARTYRLGTGC